MVLCPVFLKQKLAAIEDLSFINHTSGNPLTNDFKLAINLKKENMASVFQHVVIVIFFVATLFFWPSLITGSSLMKVSWLVLGLWQFSFIKDWQEIQKSNITPPEFFRIPQYWGKLATANFSQMFVIKCYWVLLNARVTAFTVSEVLRENWQGG